MNSSRPFEVTYSKAKNELTTCIGYVAQKYELPVSIVNMMLHEIDLEAHNQAYAIVMANCDISLSDKSSEMDSSLKEYLNTVNDTPSPSEEQQ